MQQILLTQHTIKTPTKLQTVFELTDILDQFTGPSIDYNLVSVLTRNQITSTYNTDPQSRLWTGVPAECKNVNGDKSLSEACQVGGGSTLEHMSGLSDPFLAQLPANYNTSVVGQFLPRFNSSATRQSISASDFPHDCHQLPGSFYAHYGNSSASYGGWSLEACMPADMTTSPWKATRSRQDFSEVLYLNLSVAGYDLTDPQDPQSMGGLFEITLNTTAGFFELPDYMNGQTPGPLIDGDPAVLCGHDCESQGARDPLFYLNPLEPTSKALVRKDLSNATDNISNSTLSLERVVNKGPLLTTSLALFGEESFIASRLAHPEAYIFPDGIGDVKCVDLTPVQGLLRSETGVAEAGNNIGDCLSNTAFSVEDLQSQLAAFVKSLYYDGEGGKLIENAFEAAAFLANEAWLMNNDVAKTFTVNYDLGENSEVPVISDGGIVTVSVLLMLYLCSLLAMAVYSAWGPRWTKELDAFAMMRIGASMAGRFPLLAANEADKIRALDDTPGWIGDAMAGETKVGELALGASHLGAKSMAWHR